MPHLAEGVKFFYCIFIPAAQELLSDGPPTFYMTMPPSTVSTWPVM